MTNVEIASVVRGVFPNTRRYPSLAIGAWVAPVLGAGVVAFVLAFAIGWAMQGPASQSEPLAPGGNAARLAVSGLVAVPAVADLSAAAKPRLSHPRPAVSARVKRATHHQTPSARTASSPTHAAPAPPASSSSASPQATVPAKASVPVQSRAVAPAAPSRPAPTERPVTSVQRPSRPSPAAGTGVSTGKAAGSGPAGTSSGRG